MLIKRNPWNAGSGASSPCSFARNAMFSSLFAVLELGGRCATSLRWSNSDDCSEGSELDCQSISLACVKLSCLLYLLRHLCVARDNYCCYICAGVLALNSLVAWTFVKHHDLLSRYATILHDALASVIWLSVTLLRDHRGSFPAIICCEELNEF